MAMHERDTDNMQHPGIVVMRRPAEQTARIAGTGIQVFEVVKVYRALGEQWQELREAFHWLTEEQLRAALAYAAAHPDAIESRLQVEADAENRLKRLWKDRPATAPK